MSGFSSPAPVGFSANKNGTDQTGLAVAGYRAVTFGTKRYGGSDFSTGTGLWTPRAGYITVRGSALLVSTTVPIGNQAILTVLKNGSNIVNKVVTVSVANQNVPLDVSFDDFAVGTDTYGLAVYLDGTGTFTVYGDSLNTSFSGTAYS